MLVTEGADEAAEPSGSAPAVAANGQQASLGATPSPVSGDVATPTATATAPVVPQSAAKTLTGGPADLKAVLGAARDEGSTVLLLWHSSGSTAAPGGAGPSQTAVQPIGAVSQGVAADGSLAELQREAERLELELSGLRVYLADVGASRANGCDMQLCV